MDWGEVNELVGLLKDNNILSKLDEKIKRYSSIYKGISDALIAKNMFKSPEQVKSKL